MHINLCSTYVKELRNQEDRTVTALNLRMLMGKRSVDKEDIIRTIGADVLSWLRADMTGLTKKEALHLEVIVHRARRDPDWYNQKGKFKQSLQYSNTLCYHFAINWPNLIGTYVN